LNNCPCLVEAAFDLILNRLELFKSDLEFLERFLCLPGCPAELKEKEN